MKPIRLKQAIIFAAAIGLIGAVAFALRDGLNRSPGQRASHQTAIADTQATTPADSTILQAQAAIASAPSDPGGYNALCAAYLQKARENGDFTLNAKAESALNRSLELSPDNYEAIKLHATLLLTYHRFSDALDVARRAQQLQPRDHTVYAILTDAFVELGDYRAARESVDTMMSLRPGVASYSRASYLNSLRGNTEGAIELMRAAVRSAKAQDAESLAWCRVHLGDELINAGRLAEAEREYDLALYAFPEYPLALAAKARALIAKGDFAGAIDFYERAQERVPLPDTVIALGDLYAKLGRADDAKRQYALVEFIERAGKAGIETYSRKLALFWANHDTRLDEALEVARRERAARADIYTCDALAWCLLKKGAAAEAKAAIDEAMRLGTRDALIYYHAGMIHNALGDRKNAVKYLKLALSINPSFDILQADAARRAINAA